MVIKIANNTSITREGLDMIFKHTILLKEALCGLSFDLPHLNGKTYKINNDLGSVIRPGYKKIIPELGFVREEGVGSLVIEFNVKFPEKLNKESIEKLKDIL
jgi:DnaJ-class molecular chaperone